MKNKLIKIIPAFPLYFLCFLCFLCFIVTAHLYACTSESEPDDANSGKPDNSGNPVNVITEVPEVFFTSKEIADAVMAAYSPEEFPESGLTYFFSGAEENSGNYLEPERIGFLIHRKSQIVEEFENLEDYALYVPSGQSIFEVSILRVRQDKINNIEAVKEILEKRMGRVSYGELMNYAPNEEPIYHNMKVIVAKNYVILLSTTDNGKAENIISGMIYGDSGVSLSNGAANTVGDGVPDVPNTPPVISINGDEIINVESEILFDFDIIPAIEFAVKNQEETDVRRTTVPRVDVKKHSHNTSFIIGGKCEPGAMIRVTGGTEEIYTGSDYGDYLVEVPFAAEGTTILKLTAESPGKAPSEETAFVIKARRDVDMYEKYGTFGVIVGYNYMTYFDDCLPDYIGENLISDTDIAGITTRTAKKISDLRAKGCNAEIIYLLVPNTVRTWAEDMPRRYTEEKSDTLLRQWKKGVTDGGATVLDLSDVMNAHKNDEYKIWHKTDSHWTEYGAYLGYVELMNYIAKKFPDAAPRPRSDFEFYNLERNIGDIYMRLEIETYDLKETTSFARFNFDPPQFNPNFKKGHLGLDLYDPGNIYIIHDRLAFEHTTKSNVPGNLPSVYVMRDSFEGCLHAFYTDRFSTATFQSMWSYGYFDTNEIARLNPDYILYVFSERNIKNVLYN